MGEVLAQQIDTTTFCTPYIFLLGCFWRSNKTESLIETPLISILSGVWNGYTLLEGTKSIWI